jgi:hypothetical protein
MGGQHDLPNELPDQLRAQAAPSQVLDADRVIDPGGLRLADGRGVLRVVADPVVLGEPAGLAAREQDMHPRRRAALYPWPVLALRGGQVQPLGEPAGSVWCPLPANQVGQVGPAQRPEGEPGAGGPGYPPQVRLYYVWTAPVSSVGQAYPVKTVVLRIQPDRRGRGHVKRENHPLAAQIDRLQVGRVGHDPGLLGQLPERGSQHRLTRLAGAGRRRPGPVAFVACTVMGAVQDEVVRLAASRRRTPDHYRRPVRLLRRYRQPIPGQTRGIRHELEYPTSP